MWRRLLIVTSTYSFALLVIAVATRIVRVDSGVPSWRPPEIHDWFVFVSLSVLPAVRVMQIHVATRRRQMVLSRRYAGLCVACGYDLRGTPDRCPECGNTADHSGEIMRLPLR
jgi:hypothetical protein